MTDKHYGWPTTRCYPRTMSDAFPDDAANAEWFFPPEQRWQDKLFIAIGVCLWIVIALFFVKD